MKGLKKSRFVLILSCLTALIVAGICPGDTFAAKAAKTSDKKSASTETWAKPNAAFEASKMGDMTGWDPAKWVNPEGDTIKIAFVWPHSGPGALKRRLGWLLPRLSSPTNPIRRGGNWVVRQEEKKSPL